MRIDTQGSASLEVSYPASAASLAKARAAVASLAGERGASADDLDRIRLVVSEAVANAVMHAYAGEGAGAVHLTAAVIDGELTVIVADDGCGLGAATQSPGLGHGLRVIAEGCESLSILARADGGTQLEMRFALHGQPSARRPRTQALAERVSCEDR
ncbi:MAG TPA: ATP-binding protein [Solirubrobacteraceae bacterium]|nr:ATP-binding protein [Solirubrobacteraceae bacterium]